MYRYLVLIISLVISAKCFAQSVSASDLDAVARSSKGTSIMFAQPLSEEDIAYQEEMKAREQYERAMREKEAYEQEMRARQEAMEKAEKEYRKYQVKTLSPVEQAYLDTIKQLEKEAKENSKNDDN